MNFFIIKLSIYLFGQNIQRNLSCYNRPPAGVDSKQTITKHVALERHFSIDAHNAHNAQVI